MKYTEEEKQAIVERIANSLSKMNDELENLGISSIFTGYMKFSNNKDEAGYSFTSTSPCDADDIRSAGFMLVDRLGDIIDDALGSGDIIKKEKQEWEK